MTTDATPTDAQLRDVATVEQAIATAQTERARLTPDGRPLYAPDEHARREQAIEATLAATLTRVSAAADDAVRAAAATLDGVTDTDPLNALTPTEQDSANRRAAFVKEDAAQLPLPALARRLTHALAGEDRAVLYLWLRYGEARLQAEQTSGSPTPAHVAARGQLADLVRAAGERFTDQRALANAAERLATARAFRQRVWEVTRPVNGARAAAAMRRSGRYSGVL